MFNNFFFENLGVYEIMRGNTVEPDRLQKRIWRMRFACWIPTATNTYSKYAIHIAFLGQQCFQERASMLRCAYIVCRA